MRLLFWRESKHLPFFPVLEHSYVIGTYDRDADATSAFFVLASRVARNSSTHTVAKKESSAVALRR